MLRRYALSDEVWKRIEPLVPGKAGDPGRTAADNRLFVAGVILCCPVDFTGEPSPCPTCPSGSDRTTRCEGVATAGAGRGLAEDCPHVARPRVG